jgi:hypothetical protein
VLALFSAPCHALNFDFSFSNTTGTTPGTVTGEIDGLVDNMANQQATAVIITSAPPIYNIPSPSFSIPPPYLANVFDVANGNITASAFRALHFSIPTLPSATTLDIGQLTPGIGQLAQSMVGGTIFTEGPVTFTPAPVPGPVTGAGLPGLIAAASGLMLWW